MEFLEQLWDDGVTVVTAAGNLAGSQDSHGSQYFEKSDYGGGQVMTGVLRGKGVVATVAVSDRMLYYEAEILAPGTNIVSLDHHGALYSRKSGTSMATPVVCGGTGTCITEKSKLRPEELKLKLYESARKETGMSMAWGVLDVDNLLALV